MLLPFKTCAFSFPRRSIWSRSGHFRTIDCHISLPHPNGASLFRSFRIAYGRAPDVALTLSLIPYHSHAVVARMGGGQDYMNTIEAQYYRQCLVTLLLMCRLHCTTYHSGWNLDQTEQTAPQESELQDFPPHLVEDLLEWIIWTPGKVVYEGTFALLEAGVGCRRK